jgi:hypothetical protein
MEEDLIPKSDYGKTMIGFKLHLTVVSVKGISQ